MKIIGLYIIVLFLLINGCKKSIDQGKEIRSNSPIVLSDSINEAYPQGTITWEDSSISKAYIVSLDDGEYYETVFHNHSYLRGSTWNYGLEAPNIFIVSQNVKWRIGNHEGNFPFLIAKGYLISNNSTSTALWSIKMEADEGKIFHDLYQTILYGCCGASSNYTLFNLLTGNKLMDYTEDLLLVSIPNSHPNLERFIGYKSNNSSFAEDYEMYANDSLYVGTISYACQDSLISKVILRRKPGQEDIYGLGPSLFALDAQNNSDQLRNPNDLILWSANHQNNSKAFTKFSIKIKFFDVNDSIVIPIVNDRIMTDNIDTQILSVKSTK